MKTNNVNYRTSSVKLSRNETRSWRQQRDISCSSVCLRSRNEYDDPSNPLVTVAILGPPNAGKSTLFNRFIDPEINKTYRLQSEKRGRAKKRGLKMKGGTGLRYGQKALVSSVAGTTRDRRECVGRIGSTLFRLLDTAGVDGSKLLHLTGGGSDTKHPPMERAMIRQTQQAALDADLVLLMFDARLGITYDLEEVIRWLRKLDSRGISFEEDVDADEATASARHVLILANKLEGDRWTDEDASPVMEHLREISRVGFGKPVPISAEHGEGIADIAVVIDRLVKKKRLLQEQAEQALSDTDIVESQTALLPNEADDGPEKPLQLTILGRPNVGKSTLVNALLKQERVITGATPGLTRDSISVNWTWNDRPVQLVDTAGIRKSSNRAKHGDDIEDMAVRDAMRALKVADVAVLVLDAEAGVLQRQELAIADAVVREGRSLVICANKMDLIVDQEYSAKQYAMDVSQQIELRFPMLRKTPVVAMSSLTGKNVQALMPVVFNARDRWQRVISTGILNRWLQEVTASHPPPTVRSGGTKATKIKYILQTKGRPPTFLLFCNVDDIPQSYIRFLARNFQDTFFMFGMDTRMSIKKSSETNPYSGNATKKGKGFGLGGREARKKRLFQRIKAT
eukprot:CAMPEP_0194399434 /NCGR_PEP_ID=MMETSP0174-20130528/126660_1 /TAXON_ID=216777 /ORGANISM="Proboscia alata, Strain PI-D3" /LENGTH=625 /DNA_ID=CAMNT_0039195847 /DNA_START=351 /DNA_END=2225 /DNA_ORIENTATION=-